MEKNKLLEIIKGIKHLNCVCDIEKRTKLSYSEYYPILKELEFDGKIKLSLGCPERCVGITLL